MIRKVKGGYRVVARSGRNMGTYRSLAQAKERLAQIEMFKSMRARGLPPRRRSPLKKLVKKITSVFGGKKRRRSPSRFGELPQPTAAQRRRMEGPFAEPIRAHLARLGRERMRCLKRFNRAELIAALGLEAEGLTRGQKYAATTQEFKKRIAYEHPASRATAEARRVLGC